MKSLLNILLLLISLATFCQDVNVLARSEFNAISINGATIEDIKLTNGEPLAMQELFDELTYSYENRPASGISYLIEEGLAIYFQDESSGQFEILSIASGHSSIVFRIKEINLSLGSDVSPLKSALGVGQSIIEGNGYHKIVLTTEEMSYGISIKYSPETEKILEIKYTNY